MCPLLFLGKRKGSTVQYHGLVDKKVGKELYSVFCDEMRERLAPSTNTAVAQSSKSDFLMLALCAVLDGEPSHALQQLQRSARMFPRANKQMSRRFHVA